MKNIKQKGSIVYLNTQQNGWFQFDISKPPIGSGAMGTVYLGHVYGRPHSRVAIKQVADNIASIPSVRQRARQESSMAFAHPNLVQMLGCCEEPSGKGPMFIISNYVMGINIDKFVNKTFGKMKDRAFRICKCMLPVLDALDYLHSRSIIHLDIKPSNIMVENDSNIRLMDLGIAYTKEFIDISKGGMLGTPGYAAPEQYIEPGATELSINKTTDVYEAGATLYDLLAGHVIDFDENTHILKRIPEVPDHIMDVIEKSLEYNQEDRYQSAGDFKRALIRALNYDPPKTGNKLLLILSSIAVLLIIAIVLLLLL